MSRFIFPTKGTAEKKDREGLSRLELLAALVLQGIYSNPSRVDSGATRSESYVREALRAAKAMEKALEEE